nr:MAG TPA: hypothetical protein [Caudoviricetes sp.]
MLRGEERRRERNLRRERKREEPIKERGFYYILRCLEPNSNRDN